MLKSRSIKLVIYNEYFKAALLPILIIELTLLLMYFIITGYLSSNSREVLQQEALRNIGEISTREARNITQDIEGISQLGVILQKENSRLFNKPDAFTLPAGLPEFSRAANGVHYKVKDNGGSSLWYSAYRSFNAAEQAKAILTEAMDPLFKVVQESNPNIVGIYFNSWDSLNRYYPFLPRVWEVFEPVMEIPTFNFYYLADGAHDPKRGVVWTDAYLDPAGQGWMASCIMPVYRGDFLEGVTGIDVTIDRFVKNILALNLPWNGSAFLVDQNGVILAMPESVETVLGLKELRQQVYTAHVEKDTVKPEEFNLFKNKDPLVAAQIKELFGSKQPVRNFQLGGKDYFLTNSVIPRTAWHLMLLVDKNVVNEPINRLDQITRQVGLIAFGIMILFYTAFFSYLMFKSRRTAARIAAPLSELAELTTRLKVDPLIPVAVKDSGIDEINLLGDNFMLMAHELGGMYRGLDEKVKNRTAELQSALENLQMANQQIIQQEKMASIGQLAAGVAHEINNPMAFVANNIGTLQNYVGRLLEYSTRQDAEPVLDDARRQKWAGELKIGLIRSEIGPMIAETLEGMERVKKIINELRTFSRNTVDMESADLNAGIKSVVSILGTELRFKAEVKLDLGDVPPVNCNPGQLNQVFMNIILNAAQAMESPGTITVNTWLEGEMVMIRIADTGPGMSPEVRKRVFEPFFSTKEPGKGTGLGLSVSYEIVKKHQGSIELVSELGRGTEFTVIIPRG